MSTSNVHREFENAKGIAADAQAHLSQLKDDAVRIAQSAADIGRAGVEAARDRVSQSGTAVRDAAQSAADQARAKGSDVISTLQQRIEENPVQAIAIAAGVGVVLGLLLRRR